MEDNSQERTPDIFHGLFESLEEFLETYEVDDPAVHQHHLCAALAPRSPASPEAPEGQDSFLDQLLEELQTPGPPDSQAQAGPEEPTQNQVSALDLLLHVPPTYVSLNLEGPIEEKDSELDQLLEELMEMTSREQNMSCSAQSNLTVAAHMTPDTDMLKNFHGEQTLQECATQIQGSEKTPCVYNMPYTGTQIINGIQMPMVGVQTLWGNQTLSSGYQTPSGSQMSLTGQQTVFGTPVSMNTSQSYCGNQLPFTGAQILMVNQMPFSGVHTMNGNQMPHSGVPMIPVTGLPTMTFISDQTSTDSQTVSQSGTQSLYGIQMVPQGSPLPQSGFLYASAPVAQGPTLESERPKKRQRREYIINTDGLKRYVCPFQGCGKEYNKASHLRIHERVHTGDKPYVCDVKGCPWKFPRSDELRRHKKTHTGERPFRCPQCPMDFARADHLKQHARVHR